MVGKLMTTDIESWQALCRALWLVLSDHCLSHEAGLNWATGQGWFQTCFNYYCAWFFWSTVFWDFVRSGIFSLPRMDGFWCIFQDSPLDAMQLEIHHNCILNFLVSISKTLKQREIKFILNQWVRFPANIQTLIWKLADKPFHLSCRNLNFSTFKLTHCLCNFVI